MTAEDILNCSFKDRKKSHHDTGMGSMKYSKGMRSLEKALSEPNTQNGKKSIYIHVPYCKKICNFCSMRRTINPVPDDYAALVIRQIENYGKTEYVKTSNINSVYFGGGTPTTLPAKQLAEILKALQKNFNIAKDAEISMETTVSELDDEKLKILFENGLNRISAGIQTFNDEGRKTLGRIGNGENAENFLRRTFKTGFKNVNIDIIYNYPGETKEILKEDLHKAFALDIAGFSFYSLIVMDTSKIGRSVDKEEYAEKTLHQDAEFFLTILEESRKAGYDFLEITKLVKPGRDNYEYIRSGHLGGDIFPVGAGAGGFVNNTAVMNPLDKEKCADQINGFDKTSGMWISEDYRRIKRFSGQLQEGLLDLSFLTKEESDKIYDMLTGLEKETLIKKDEGSKNYKFTDKGFFWGNSLAAELGKSIF